MNKTELVESVRAKLGNETSKASAERAVSAVLDSIVEGVKKTGDVQVIGFGTFSVVKRAARKGINPKTGAPLQIKARQSVKFKAGAGFKEAAAKAKAKASK